MEAVHDFKETCGFIKPVDGGTDFFFCATDVMDERTRFGSNGQTIPDGVRVSFHTVNTPSGRLPKAARTAHEPAAPCLAVDDWFGNEYPNTTSDWPGKCPQTKLGHSQSPPWCPQDKPGRYEPYLTAM